MLEAAEPQPEKGEGKGLKRRRSIQRSVAKDAEARRESEENGKAPSRRDAGGTFAQTSANRNKKLPDGNTGQ